MKYKKVLLIYVPFVFGKKPLFGLNPLGIQYIAAYLNSKGYDAKCLDAEILGLSIEQIMDVVSEYRPDLVGLSFMTMSFLAASTLSKEIKQRFPGTLIAAGGPHVSSVLGEVLDITREFDYAIYSEGEEAAYRLLNVLNGDGDLSLVPNLIWRDGAEIIVNPMKPLDNLDGLPFPQIEDFIGFKKYPYNVPYASYKPISIMASRACPFNCTFCCVKKIHGQQVHYRSPQNIIAEIKDKVRRYNTRYFIFKDSTLTVNRAWSLDLFNEMRAQELGIKWRCNTRVDRLDEELISAMKAAGCEMIQFGIESASPSVLKTLKKGFTIEKAQETLKIVKKYGIYAHLSFMIGNPGETKADIAKIFPFLKKVRPEFMRVFVTTYYPGTEIYESSKHLLSEEKWYLKEHYASNERYLFPDIVLGTLPTEYNKIRLIRYIYFRYYFNPVLVFEYLKLMIKRPVFVFRFIQVFYNMLFYILGI